MDTGSCLWVEMSELRVTPRFSQQQRKVSLLLSVSFLSQCFHPTVQTSSQSMDLLL
jgi:hypothetical protein